jgi:hypothetical protein
VEQKSNGVESTNPRQHSEQGFTVTRHRICASALSYRQAQQIEQTWIVERDSTMNRINEHVVSIVRIADICASLQ